MEDNFIRASNLLNVPLRPIEIAFEDTSLTGYYSEHDVSSRPKLVMIGGGDTFREDLFYFAGILDEREIIMY